MKACTASAGTPSLCAFIRSAQFTQAAWNSLAAMQTGLRLGSAAAMNGIASDHRKALRTTLCSLRFDDACRAGERHTMAGGVGMRSEEHTSELQSHSFISYAV